MVAVLDAYARREAQRLLEHYGGVALTWVQERAQDAASRQDAVLVGYWEVIAFYIRFMQVARDCELTANNQTETQVIV